MKTRFIQSSEKGELIKLLKNGNDKAISCVIDEIDRLEAIIKGFELAYEVIESKFNSHLYKEPTVFDKGV